MKSFGIGLAILVAGFVSYSLTNALQKAANAITGISGFLQKLAEAFLLPQGVTIPQALQKLAEAGFLPEGVTIPKDLGPGVVSAVMGIPKDLINIAPYICLGVMAFGVVWFWLIEPMLYLLTPPKKEVKKGVVGEAVVTPSAPTMVRQEVSGYSGKELKQLVSEAIEQWVTDAIREKTERERGK